MGMSIEEKEVVFNNVLDQMAAYTFPSISQICGAFDEHTGELLGSGTFLTLFGKTYLLTAEHVAKRLFEDATEDGRKYEAGLCHSVGNAERMMYVTNPWSAWPNPKDLAVTQVDSVVLDGTTIVPRQASDFASDTRGLGQDIYFIHGYPGEKSRFTAFFGRGVASETLPYGGWPSTTTWPDYDEEMHFAISYPKNELTHLPDPEGLSGAVVWKTNKVGTGGEWTPEMAKIVGVVIRYGRESRSLIATRIEYVRGFLLHTLRSEYAYFRWIKRGRPLWEDIVDWRDAERAIPYFR